MINKATNGECQVMNTKEGRNFARNWEIQVSSPGEESGYRFVVVFLRSSRQIPRYYLALRRHGDASFKTAELLHTPSTCELRYAASCELSLLMILLYHWCMHFGDGYFNHQIIRFFIILVTWRILKSRINQQRWRMSTSLLLRWYIRICL